MDSICKSCEYLRICGRKIIGSEKTVMTGCSRYKERKPITNADRIRAMSDTELALWLAAMLGVNPFDGTGNDYKKWLDWLKQEVTE